MKPTSSKDGPLAIWMDLTAEPIWKYEELPPFLLPEMMQLDSGEVNDSELSRAIWFWCRRPKLMFHDSAALIIAALCVLLSLSIALVNWHLTPVPKRAAEVTIIVFEVAFEIYAIGYRFKFLRWRREYEGSIDRLIRSLHWGL
jgi:hypothetical protein